jgi:hypothetical protein
MDQPTDARGSLAQELCALLFKYADTFNSSGPLTEDECLQVMRNFADRGRVSDIRNSPVATKAYPTAEEQGLSQEAHDRRERQWMDGVAPDPDTDPRGLLVSEIN